MLWGGRVEANLICVLKGNKWIVYLSSYQRVAGIRPAFPVW